MAAEHEQVYIRYMPPGLKARLVADAEAQGTNMTDVAVAILAEYYRVPIERPSRVRQTHADAESMKPVNLRLPLQLHTQIDLARAANRRKKIQHECLVTLCAHYGLPAPAPAARRRTTRRRRLVA